MRPSYRLYNCARCHVQVNLCTRCDRGQVYCEKVCSEEARRESCKLSGQRYQATERGKRKHAARQVRYCMRQAEEIMTHQGIAAEGGTVVLEGMSNGSSPAREPEVHFECEETQGCSAPGPESQSKRGDATVCSAQEPEDRSERGSPCCSGAPEPAVRQKCSASGYRRSPSERAAGLVRCSFCGRLCGPFARLGYLGESKLPTAQKAGRPRVGGSDRRRRRATDKGGEH